jgi:hypothetical protein
MAGRISVRHCSATTVSFCAHQQLRMNDNSPEKVRTAIASQRRCHFLMRNL